MRIRTRTHTSNSIEIDGIEVPVEYAPYYEDFVLAERVGDKLVVAYLVQDTDAFNPMKAGDANGDIYTMPSRYGGGSISDNASEIYSQLCVNGGRWSDPEPDIDYPFHLGEDPGAGKTSCRDLAADQVYEELLKDPEEVADYFRREGMPALGLKSRYVHWLKSKEGEDLIFRDLLDVNGVFSERVEVVAREMFRKHWKRIVGPYVVPMYYSAERGSCSISFSEWDGDWEDLPNCIWVADKLAIENIDASCHPDNVEIKQVAPWPPSTYAFIVDGQETFRGTFGEVNVWSKTKYPPNFDDLRATAIRYAKAVCGEYASWCEGDCYGCVVETFTLAGEGDDQEWEREGDEEACWGFIGSDHAMDSLRAEFFEPALKAIKKANKEEA